MDSTHLKIQVVEIMLFKRTNLSSLIHNYFTHAYLVLLFMLSALPSQKLIICYIVSL